MFYWASKLAISFFSSKFREKEVFFKLGYERGIDFGRGGGGGWVGGGGEDVPGIMNFVLPFVRLSQQKNTQLTQKANIWNSRPQM